jgi:phosphoribosylanthranilate isomerase
MLVMITGIRNVEDASNIRKLGANALGLLVKHADDSQPGYISPTIATSIAELLSHVPKHSPSFRRRDQQEYQNQHSSSQIDHRNSSPNPSGKREGFCESVLVTHLLDVQKIISLACTIGVTSIQLVGKNTPEDVSSIKDIEVIKSIPVLDHSCISNVKRYIDVVDAIELDTIDIATNKIGGTGKTHNWTISKNIVQEYGYKVPIILAGGLNSDNIEEAIQTVRPFGVDVSSGINYQDGINDQNERLTKFLSKANYF